MTGTQEAIDWYQDIYADPKYGMGMGRKRVATQALINVPRGTLLDVGCGRGEMLDIAQNLGFTVTGLEASQPMTDGQRVIHGAAQTLPFVDGAFDVATCFDVIEHIPAADVRDVLDELNRVAHSTILITASNLPSMHNGIDLHITKYEYTAWDAIFRTLFPGRVTWLRDLKSNVSEMWRIDK